MVILGLLLIALGALAIAAGIFLTDVEGGHVEFLGIDMGAEALFLIGVAAGLAVLWGFGILKFGTKREIKQRREHKKLGELSEKLDKVEAERRAEDTTEN
ncbi:hypothetical protein [Nocardioides speluncae]|uniref:hypothetical protein n=1 Tax=Nocardioides speluncae TaxID=2670337 RepID=UPI000D68CB8E|nr:hypothetical protein [Nocardioides speluncae]